MLHKLVHCSVMMLHFKVTLQCRDFYHHARTQKVLSKRERERGGGYNSYNVLFLFLRGETGSKIALKAGHHRLASNTPFQWRFAGGPVMAHLNGVSQAGR